MDAIELAEFQKNETVIERGLGSFIEVGTALLDIRDRRQYRELYSTFEEYCQKRWNFNSSRARQLILASRAAKALQSVTNVTLQNEGQARALRQFPAEFHPVIINTAAARYDIPTASEIERVGRVVTEMATTGHVDIANGISTPIDAALTVEDEEAIKRSQVYIHENGNGNGRQKPKSNIQGEHEDDQPDPRDRCQTPDYAVDPLLPFLHSDWIIFEPAYGDGLLADALYDGGINDIIKGDLLTGQDFLKVEPENNWDMIVTNPPFSTKYAWIERCYALGKPFALLMPVETLGAKTAQDMFREHGIQVIFMNQRIDFKMPNKGWGGSAQFPSAWFCFGLDLPQQMIFADIVEAKREFVEALIEGEDG